jgi:hypothetical protein
MNYVIIALIVILMTTLHALALEPNNEFDPEITAIEKILALDDEEPLPKNKPDTSKIVREIANRPDNQHPLKPFIEDKKIKMHPNSEAEDNKNISQTEDALLTDE